MSKLLGKVISQRPGEPIKDNKKDDKYVSAKDISEKRKTKVSSSSNHGTAYESQDFRKMDTIKMQGVIDNWYSEQEKQYPRRMGTHASAILSYGKEFCFREHVLLDRYPDDTLERVTPPALLRIFAQGTYMHMKWQALFESVKSAVHIEQPFYSEEYDLYFTPDAVITHKGRVYVVEIKSMNTMSYSRLTGPPKFAVEQCMLYMHLTGIGCGIILVEDKDKQQYMPWVVDYNVEYVLPYLKRIKELIAAKDAPGVPMRICKNETVKRALECPVRNVCFQLEE